MSSSADPAIATLAAYEQGASLYAQHSFDRSALAHLHARFAALLTPGARVLDLGGGPGHDAAALTRRGLVAINCDPTAGLLSEARRHPEIASRLVLADARHLPFASESFDGVWACASLLHVPRDHVGDALREAQRILKHGGVVFTSMQAGSIEGIVPASDTDPLAPRYYVYYGAEDWRALVQAAGFEVIDQRVAPGPGGLNPGATGWIETFACKP